MKEIFGYYNNNYSKKNEFIIFLENKLNLAKKVRFNHIINNKNIYLNSFLN